MPSREFGPKPYLAPYSPWPRRFATVLAIAIGAAGGTYVETQYKVYEAGFKAVGVKNPLAPATWPHRLPENAIPQPTIPKFPPTPTLTIEVPKTSLPSPVKPTFQEHN